MNVALVALALLTGGLTGALFAYLGVPIPAPPNVVGVAGIVGIFLGYKVVELAGVGVDLLALLGLG
ncbi:MAG: XapX domain-containing protein [Halobacteriaceae archaeon]